MTSFQAIQTAFANNVRDPLRNPMPLEVEPRRMRIYQELIYNNIESFIANGFPILRHLTPNDRWHAMVRDFINRHASLSPYFCDIGREFLDYLQRERHDESDPPYLLELAHFEQVELALEISDVFVDEPDEHYVSATSELLGNRVLFTLFSMTFTLSPLAYLLVYRYAVHRFSVGEISLQPSTYYLLVYRNRDFKVICMEVSAVTARMISIFQQQPGISVQTVLEMIMGELGIEVGIAGLLAGCELGGPSVSESAATFCKQASECLFDLIARGILCLGFYPHQSRCMGYK